MVSSNKHVVESCFFDGCKGTIASLLTVVKDLENRMTLKAGQLI